MNHGIHRLDPPIWLDTPRGPGYAIFMTDPGMDYNRVWTVVLQKSGEIWDFQNPDVRACKNITYAVNCSDAP